MLKLAKNQANAKQHSETELLLFEDYLHSSYSLSSKIDGTYSEKISNHNEDENEKRIT